MTLRIFLALIVTNCSAERLKHIKNPKWTTMRQEKFHSLSLLMIEADLLRKIIFDDIIKDLARHKSRKKKSLEMWMYALSYIWKIKCSRTVNHYYIQVIILVKKNITGDLRWDCNEGMNRRVFIFCIKMKIPAVSSGSGPPMLVCA